MDLSLGKPNLGFQAQEKEFKSRTPKGFQNMITFVGLSDFLFFFGVNAFFLRKNRTT